MATKLGESAPPRPEDCLAQLLALKQELSTLTSNPAPLPDHFLRLRKSACESIGKQRQGCETVRTLRENQLKTRSTHNLSRHSTTWSGGDYRRHEVFRSWHALLQTSSQSQLMPASANTNSTSQRVLRDLHHYASSSEPVGRRQKRASSLHFEIVAWKRAADKRAAKKTQPKKRAELLRAELQQCTAARACRLAAIQHQLKTNACANCAIQEEEEEEEEEEFFHKDKLDALLEWRSMAVLTLCTASIACIFCAFYAV
jgi:hypothetical protein